MGSSLPSPHHIILHQSQDLFHVLFFYTALEMQGLDCPALFKKIQHIINPIFAGTLVRIHYRIERERMFGIRECGSDYERATDDSTLEQWMDCDSDRIDTGEVGCIAKKSGEAAIPRVSWRIFYRECNVASSFEDELVE